MPHYSATLHNDTMDDEAQAGALMQAKFRNASQMYTWRLIKFFAKRTFNNECVYFT